jgi:hypothetical protein
VRPRANLNFCVTADFKWIAPVAAHTTIQSWEISFQILKTDFYDPNCSWTTLPSHCKLGPWSFRSTHFQSYRFYLGVRWFGALYVESRRSWSSHLSWIRMFLLLILIPNGRLLDKRSFLYRCSRNIHRSDNYTFPTLFRMKGFTSLGRSILNLQGVRLCFLAPLHWKAPTATSSLLMAWMSL